MEKPVFSVIIPTFNSAAFIRETLLSLSNQFFKNFEVIIVDDGSADGSVQLSKELLGEYRLFGKVISRPPEVIKGVASCRNLAVKHASADWISFLDGDDTFLPAKLQNIFNNIQKYSPGCMAYHHACRNFEDGTGKTVSIVSKNVDGAPRDVLVELLNENIMVTSTVTIHKKLFEDLGGFNTDLHGVEDYMMWLLISKKTKWCYDNEVLTGYRVRNNSLMSGREMTHYVTQNSKLVEYAKTRNEFSAEELAKIDQYLFVDLMHYYAMVSLENKGWGDFLKGLASLAKRQRTNLAVSLLFKFSKRHFLSKAAKIVKR